MAHKMIELECLTCYKKFERKFSEYNRNVKRSRHRNFCSRSCRSLYRTEQKRIAEKESGQRLVEFNKNFGHYCKKKDEYSSYRRFLTAIRSRCYETNKEYDIDLEYLKTLWESQNGICPHTGWELTKKQSTGHKIALTPNRASLDRIDNSKGYMKGNVVFVAWMWQLAKNTFPEEEVLKFCEAVHEHQKLKNSGRY